MAEGKFEANEALLSSCARSELAAYVAKQSHVGDVNTSNACCLLHRQHALHYGRSSPSTFTKANDTYQLDGRLERFVQTVMLVHSHNKKPNLHRLTLNRFADQDLFPSSSSSSDANLNERSLESGEWDFSFFDWDSIDKEWVLSPFEDEIAANVTLLGRGNLYHTRRKRQAISVGDAVSDKLKFPARNSARYFAVPSLDDPDLDGELLKVKPRKSVAKLVESGEFDQTDEFGKRLDWSTDNNPDGVPIVKDPFDQGECGSCWAFVATGSLEASVARRQAQEAYSEYLEEASSQRRKRKHIRALHEDAVDFAQSVEDAAFRMANLSIQELIDCDTAADQGCIGGNPLLAFYFIHRYGLTSWSEYPYAGREDTCHKKWVSRPVAKVKSWGIISPNHEHHMQMVIRFIGPIAVGVNGADRSFLAYKDGIFDHPTCRQGANHALLITGYGHEYTSTGELVKYWIARNSWGTDWGEDGYIRVKRGDGLKGTEGVCGIARSPSVALGGMMLANRHKLAPYQEPEFSQPDYMPLRSSPPNDICGRFGFESCGHMVAPFGDHKAFLLGMTGIMCALFLAAWPLSYECRQRRLRRRRLREIRGSLRLDGARRFPRGARPILRAPTQQPAEIDPLLGDRNITHYGE